MKHFLLIISLLISSYHSFAQNDLSLDEIKIKLDSLSVTNNTLNTSFKTDISVSYIKLSNLLLGLSEVYGLNITLDRALEKKEVINKFSDVTIAELLLFLCKQHHLTIDFTGNILSFRPRAQEVKPKNIHVDFNSRLNTISIDVSKEPLHLVCRKITELTGQNIMYSPSITDRLIQYFVKNAPIAEALKNLAHSNKLEYHVQNDGFYVLSDSKKTSSFSRLSAFESSNTKNTLEVLDSAYQILQVSLSEESIETVVMKASKELGLNIYTASSLSELGNISCQFDSITYMELLTFVFESQTNQQAEPSGNKQQRPNSSSENLQGKVVPLTFRKINDRTYIFGTKEQVSLHKTERIHLLHRSVELLSDPKKQNLGLGSLGALQNNQIDNTSFSTGRNRQNISSSPGNNQQHFEQKTKTEALISIIPDKLKEDLDIKIDYELNSFYVHGSSENIERFKAFIREIDQPVPVVLIEVMIMEINDRALIETGINWGIGDNPSVTKGSIFPGADLTLGAGTINKIFGNFNNNGPINLGKVVPNFFANIKAIETSGLITIKSTPKLSTLNGHRATFSNGRMSYYAVTQRNIYGTDNPQTSELTNYYPINVQLGLSIKPLISADSNITLDIYVVQSNFEERIEKDAPPDVRSREFSSIIRVKDQDVIVLGGLEENSKENSGSGVPLLSKIPVIKWLFSGRKSEKVKKKLSVIIKPTIIY